MLYAKLMVGGLVNEMSHRKIVDRLRAIGFVDKVRILPLNNIIAFEYATFRDMDEVTTELSKMGISILKTQSKIDKKNILIPKKAS